MKREKLVELYQELQKVKNTPKAKFSYAVAKNLAKIEVEIKALKEAQNPSEEFTKLQEEFEPERIAIVEKFAKKDSEDKPIKKMITMNGRQIEIYDMDPENQVKSNEECELSLRKKNAEVYKARVKQLDEYQKMLQEDVPFEAHKVPLSEVPENISVANIMEIIEE